MSLPFRWVLLQEVLNNWQEYRDEERRLTKWLSEKENEVDRLKHVDLGDPDAIAHHLQKLMVSYLKGIFSGYGARLSSRNFTSSLFCTSTHV